ncbi:ubiquitin [Bifidobacterium sp. UTCIF-37]|uniref:Prokaryotic ubiquitin-like protein Pup n=2 Tax=Bifidobacterium callitrichos TaxID=762209 RepID=A0A2T3GA80_9BIFI|nr:MULTISPECIES: ubiquitin-like protein Pup [Bifidobacterium]KAA8815945.1 ubiquitin-like protein Pup [Bifidobacterium callitrichos]KFI51389.1 hypothetical protein BCAL_1120 [Bifidobacterium callitrichos DSM 23973]PST46394.1 ubiquitin-like protein Pup [Bifidobacterium callitrichos]TPF86442.1 ubiquitin [Bifidobacterium sp. UTCIF-37]TPF89392.1 ubiquitin [Bifidobacterium sp. UTCIF-38]
MPQQFEQGQSQRNDNEQVEQDAPLAAAQTETAADTDVDALDAVLDDIESTLETNAEEYVKSFVQKGGE